jgi:hypothetical protein
MAIPSFVTSLADHWILISVVIVLVVAAIVWFSLPVTWRDGEGLPGDNLERGRFPEFSLFSGSRDEPWLVWLFRQLF